MMLLILKGGPGSGFFGQLGRPGLRSGSMAAETGSGSGESSQPSLPSSAGIKDAAARAYWNAHFRSKTLTIHVKGKQGVHKVTVEFGSNNTHMWTREAKAGDAIDAYDDPRTKRGERTLEVERAVLMDRLFRTIEAPWRVLVGKDDRHVCLGSPPLPDGGSYVVVLEPKADGSNGFVTAHPRSKEWMATMRAPGRRTATPHGPLTKSETPPRDGVSSPVLHGVTGPAGPTLFAESPAASASTREDRPGVASEGVSIAFSFFKALAPGERWITVRPNGPGTEGHPLLIKPAGGRSIKVIRNGDNRGRSQFGSEAKSNSVQRNGAFEYRH